METMTRQARLAHLDAEKSKLMALIAKAHREGRSDPRLLSQVREISRERVELATA
jgi:hypothetical protein